MSDTITIFDQPGRTSKTNKALTRRLRSLAAAGQAESTQLASLQATVQSLSSQVQALQNFQRGDLRAERGLQGAFRMTWPGHPATPAIGTPLSVQFSPAFYWSITPNEIVIAGNTVTMSFPGGEYASAYSMFDDNAMSYHDISVRPTLVTLNGLPAVRFHFYKRISGSARLQCSVGGSASTWSFTSGDSNIWAAVGNGANYVQLRANQGIYDHLVGVQVSYYRPSTVNPILIHCSMPVNGAVPTAQLVLPTGTSPVAGDEMIVSLAGLIEVPLAVDAYHPALSKVWESFSNVFFQLTYKPTF